MQHPSRIFDWPGSMHVAEGCATTSSAILIHCPLSNHHYQLNTITASQPATSARSLLSGCSISVEPIIVLPSSMNIIGLRIAGKIVKTAYIFVSNLSNLQQRLHKASGVFFWHCQPQRFYRQCADLITLTFVSPFPLTSHKPKLNRLFLPCGCQLCTLNCSLDHSVRFR